MWDQSIIGWTLDSLCTTGGLHTGSRVPDVQCVSILCGAEYRGGTCSDAHLTVLRGRGILDDRSTERFVSQIALLDRCSHDGVEGETLMPHHHHVDCGFGGASALGGSGQRTLHDFLSVLGAARDGL